MNKLKVPRYIQWIVLTGIIFLFLMSLMRMALVLSFTIPTNNNTPFADVFLLGLRFDIRDVCIASLLLFIIGTIPALHPFEKKWGRRTSFIIWTILIIAFAFFYVVDFANYAYLSQRLRASLLNLLQDTKTSLGLVWENYHVGWIILAMILLVSAMLGLVRMLYNIVLSRPKLTTKVSRITWSIVFFLIMALGIFGRFNQYPLRWSDAFSFENDYAANVALNPFQSFFSSLEFRKSSYDLDATKNAYSWMSNYLGVDKPDSNSLNYNRFVHPIDTAQPKPLNVVVVICESFSAYKSSMYGNPLNTTPYFNELCKQGIFFNRCFTSSYGTARGIWATITGIPDVDFINTSSRNPLAVDQHSIINDFTGHDKMYFIGGSTSWANIRGLLTNNIKDVHIYEQDDYDAPKIDVWGVSDKNLFLGANKILAAKTKPFFAIIQTSDNHRPYTIPEEDLNEFKKQAASKDSLKKYGFEDVDEFNAFRYTDFGYRKFMEAASKEAYFKNTLFVFIGDHGIQGDVGNMFSNAWTNELSAEHVPLLFYAPGILQPKEYGFYASQIDLLPTVAGICKIPYRNSTLGRDLLDTARITSGAVNNNAVFILDPNNKRIGVIKGNYYFSYGAGNSSPAQIMSVVDNNKVVLTDSLSKEYKAITDAFYETARYQLLNNKK
ncbi:LTA synthase family protein [Limnovirga soli]|uniref:Sulfatase-like hydrolase/transferase n=1 Tax=Limnovirga soli TaxID=2656915 RepID=A0A8J8JWT6_9BACT|nr:alkaline phosphatase family protein [Limnovirga soli]NNV55641.1 sulfatase-like hydrolase/transferase [Limnovirga soli]